MTEDEYLSVEEAAEPDRFRGFGEAEWDLHAAAIQRERDELRAENEQLRDSNNRLRAMYKGASDGWLEEEKVTERLRAVVEVAREVQRGSETWYVPGDTLDRLNRVLAALDHDKGCQVEQTGSGVTELSTAQQMRFLLLMRLVMQMGGRVEIEGMGEPEKLGRLMRDYELQVKGSGHGSIIVEVVEKPSRSV